MQHGKPLVKGRRRVNDDDIERRILPALVLALRGNPVDQDRVAADREPRCVDDESVPRKRHVGDTASRDLDGVRVAQNVELFADNTSAGRVMYANSAVANPTATHTLQIMVLGTKLGKSKGTRVDVDAFLSTQAAP